ncbi:hypothetical protein [Kitasatospora aureofaciens]|uniref:hypothetical protein n=1 Tax=Kitasatospora aureofaciens TaxID=1894 RepID=UPI0036F4A422
MSSSPRSFPRSFPRVFPGTATAPTPSAGCGALDMATSQPGRAFYDNSTVNAVKW